MLVLETKNLLTDEPPNNGIQYSMSAHVRKNYPILCHHVSLSVCPFHRCASGGPERLRDFPGPQNEKIMEVRHPMFSWKDQTDAYYSFSIKNSMDKCVSENDLPTCPQVGRW